MVRRSAILAILAASALGAVMCRDSPNQPSPIGARNIDGVYAMRVESQCGSLPESARVRTYTATISGTPNGVAALSGATFWQHPDGEVLHRLSVVVTGSSVRLSTSQVPGYGVVERVTDDLFVEVSGTGTAAIAGWTGAEPLRVPLPGTIRAGEHLRDDDAHVRCQPAESGLTVQLTRTTGGAAEVGVVPSIARVEIAGPASLAPDAAATYQAMAQLSDGSTTTLNRGVSWRSSADEVEVSPDGRVRGVRVGDGNIEAVAVRPHLHRLNTTREVIVVPEGTFRVVGTVRDGGEPVAGARVEVASQGREVTETFTDGGGRYRLYGVPPDAEFSVSRDGYVPVTTRQRIADHAALDFGLELVEPRPQLEGTYTLTIAMDGPCGSFRPLPDALQQRTYTASIEQTGARLDVTLSGAQFALDAHGHGNRFQGRIEPDGVTFTLGTGAIYYYYFYSYFFSAHPDVAERLSDQSVLVTRGTARTAITPTGMSGTLQGSMVQYGAQFPSAQYLASCDGPPYAFSLTRVH